MKHTIEELATHARELAKAFNVDLREDPNRHELSSGAKFVDEAPKPGKLQKGLLHCHVDIATINSERRYAIALHEMGHICAPGGCLTDRERTPQVKLEEETAAWNWAKHYSLEWTMEMEETYVRGMSTYFSTKEMTLRGGGSGDSDPFVDMLKQLLLGDGMPRTAYTPRTSPPRPTESLKDFLKRRK